MGWDGMRWQPQWPWQQLLLLFNRKNLVAVFTVQCHDKIRLALGGSLTVTRVATR
jgi:hypothetical protein